MAIPYRAVGMLLKPINCAKIVIRKLSRVAPRPLGQWRISGRNSDSLPLLHPELSIWRYCPRVTAAAPFLPRFPQLSDERLARLLLELFSFYHIWQGGKLVNGCRYCIFSFAIFELQQNDSHPTAMS